MRIKKILAHNEVILFLILLFVMLMMGIHSPRFLAIENIFDILRNAAFFGVISIGFLFVLVAGGIDISFMATAIVAQYFAASLLSAHQEMPVLLVLLSSVVPGFLLGSLNAVLIHRLKAPPIILSIAMMNAYYGITQFASEGRWIYDFPAWFHRFPGILVLRLEPQDGGFYGFSIFTAIWFAGALMGHIILKHTKLGRKLYATGGNLEAARRAGINIWRMRWFAYAFLGSIAGLGGLMHALITQTVAPNALWGQEFDVVAAVILGGAAITGGRGSVFGTVVGTVLVAVVKNGLTIMKVPSFYHQVFIGGVLLLSVMITALRSKTLEKHSGGLHVGTGG